VIFKVQFLSDKVIRATADSARRELLGGDSTPVNAELALERMGVDFEFVQGLSEALGTLAMYSHKSHIVFIDKDHYYDMAQFRRVRFTLAHELGHVCMHKELLEQFEFKSEEDYLKFRSKHAKELGSFEYQAHEFAGRFMVPHEALLERVRENLVIVKEHAFTQEDRIDKMCNRLSRKFGVSVDVLKKRLEKEGLLILMN
jgi:Zn-dependent peptidase ImmA (M78 family)